MSHISLTKVKIKTEIAKEVCKLLGYKYQENKTVNFYKGNQTGLAIYLKDWQYPIVVQNEQIAYDNYNGDWGNIDELHKFQREYTKTVVLKAVQQNNLSCSKITQQNDEIFIQIDLD